MLCFLGGQMSVVALPATITALIAGLKFWEDKKSLSAQEIKDRDDAVNVVLDALVLTKSYLYDCSGQVKLATVLESFQYKRSDSFGVNPPLY